MNNLLEKIIMVLLFPIRKGLIFVRHQYGRMRLARLISCGLKVGKNVYIENGVNFDPIYPYLIEIGDNCRIASGVTILAHDATIFRQLGVNRIAPVKILAGSFIGENALILPGATIGPNAMIAAGAMVNRDIGDGKIAAGNPARPYANYSDMIKKYREIATPENIFFKQDIENGIISHDDIVSYLNDNPIAFVQGVPRQDPCYINEDMDNIRKASIESYENLIRSKLDK